MPAVADQVLRARVQRRDQVEARDAARRAASRVAVDRQAAPPASSDGRRAARRRSRRRPGASPPPPAPAPALRPARRAARSAPSRRRRRPRARCPALGVGLVELGGDRLGAVGVVGQHQLHPGVGPVQAPGRVDPRRQPEPERVLGNPSRARPWRPPSARAGPARGAVRITPSPWRTRRRFSPIRGTMSATVASATRSSSSRSSPAEGGGPPQRQRELVGDPGGAERAERIAAHDRVQDRAVGQQPFRGGCSASRPRPPWRLVVVGDDHLDPGGPQRRHLLNRADPAVDGDHQLGAAALQLLDRPRAEPVAVAHAVGNQPVALGPQRPQRRDEDRGRGDPVDVVVAVDRHPRPAPGVARAPARPRPPSRRTRAGRARPRPPGTRAPPRRCGSRAGRA